LDKKFELGPRWQGIVKKPPCICIKQVMRLVEVTGKRREEKRREEKRREEKRNGHVL
jgi:hypothetical protein